jgi:hypothetical protein
MTLDDIKEALFERLENLPNSGGEVDFPNGKVIKIEGQRGAAVLITGLLVGVGAAIAAAIVTKPVAVAADAVNRLVRDGTELRNAITDYRDCKRGIYPFPDQTIPEPETSEEDAGD